MPKLTPEERIEQLEKEVFDLRVALVFLVKEKIVVSEGTFAMWKRKVLNYLKQGILKSALTPSQGSIWTPK